jgi:Mlc titration factor MtfA (ptsG expression regulator)
MFYAWNSKLFIVGRIYYIKNKFYGVYIMSDEESKLVINTTFILDNDAEVTIKNINITTLNKLNNADILAIIQDTKWYLYGNYDKISLFSEEYLIVSKTKKKIELVRSNIKKSSSDS